MTISFNSVKQAIKRHLSIIGKRMYDKDGKNMFSNITVSTAEDPIFEQYIAAGAQNVETALRPLLTSYLYTQSGITIELTNTRGADDFDSRCMELIMTYITLFSVGEYLGMAHSDFARKYVTDSESAMTSLQMYAFHKEAPNKSLSSYTDITGEIN